MFEKIAKYTAAELALAKQVTALEELKNDPELKLELEFNSEFEALLSKYSFSKTKLYGFLEAQYGAAKAVETKAPSPAKAGKASKEKAGYEGHKDKLWTNPHTGEAVKSRRRDHKTILGWIEQHGLEEVLTWMQRL
jgi:hypothetical protein